MSNSKINIYYSADNKLYEQLLISLISLTENNKDNDLHIYNFDVEVPEYNANSKKLSQNQIDVINRIITKYNTNNTFTEINVSDLVRAHLLSADSPNVSKKNHGYKNNAFLYIRTLLPYVENMPDKLLGLDTDTIICKDISELGDMDISNHDGAGRKEACFEVVEMPEIGKRYSFNIDGLDLTQVDITKPFIQNGVMLLNVKRINQIYIKLLDLYKTKYLGFAGDMFFVNYLSQNILVMDNKFNAYKYNNKNYIHHCCATGDLPGGVCLKLIFFIFLHKRSQNIDDFFPITCFKAKRLKPEDIAFRHHYPLYKKYYDILDALMRR